MTTTCAALSYTGTAFKACVLSSSDITRTLLRFNGDEYLLSTEVLGFDTQDEIISTFSWSEVVVRYSIGNYAAS